VSNMLRLELTPQEAANLRQLVAVCVWIRGEQLDSPTALHTIAATGIDATMPPIQLNRDMLSIATMQLERSAALEWWGKLHGLLTLRGEEKLTAKWMQPK